MFKKLFLALIMLLPLMAFAQVAGPSPLPSDLPNIPGVLDGIANHISLQGASITVGMVLIELVLRLTKSPLPLSWLWLIAYSLHALARLAEVSASWLDKVLPQRAA